jgi:protein-disulfide isomerase
MNIIARMLCWASAGLLAACAVVSPDGGLGDAASVAEVEARKAALLDSAHQAVLGNPRGDVTVVEFFDYNCGYCRVAAAQLTALVDEDKGLRIVLKEWPVFGAASTDAARVSIAARMQDGGPRFRSFHEALFRNGRRATKATALEAAEAAGYDVAALESRLDSDEVEATLREAGDLAKGLGLRGTPTFVVGTEVIHGEIGRESLRAAIARARAG